MVQGVFMPIPYKNLEITPRIQKGLAFVNEGRFEFKKMWGDGLTVLNEKTTKVSLVKRKALAVNKVLSEMPIKIEGHELIVGVSNPNSFGSGCPFPEYATTAEKEAATKKYTGVTSVFGHFTPSYKKYLKLGVIGLLQEAEYKLSQVKKKGKEPDKMNWYEAVIIALKGLKYLFQRYSDLASELSRKEKDIRRKLELKEIAKITGNLAVRAPQNFHEALQALWLAHVAFQSTMNFLALGRFDQYLWPYLKKDLDNKLTLEQAQELIDCLWLKFNDKLQTYDLAKDNTRKSPFTNKDEMVASFIGFFSLFMGGKVSNDLITQCASDHTIWQHSIVLSGITTDGVDGTNPLTYLCLNAIYRLKLPQPPVYVRFHDNSPDELYQRVADCLRNSAGPSIYNDEVMIPAWEKQGIRVEHARDYVTDGCWDCNIQGRSQYKFGFISAPEILCRTLFPGKWEEMIKKYVKGPDVVMGSKISDRDGMKYLAEFDPFKDSIAPDPLAFTSFGELMDSFKGELDKNIKGYVDTVDRLWDSRGYDIAPIPLISACTEGPLESGKDITQGGIEYKLHSPVLAGISHAVDSLMVIKKLCFDDKTVELAELLEAVYNNWENKETLRHLVMTRVPAYGNDIDEVDDIAREVASYFVETVRKYSSKTKGNIKLPPSIGTFEFYTVLGHVLPATPDGRLAQEPISSNASPSLGRAINGLTASVNSYLKLPLGDLPNGTPIDLAMNKRSGLFLEPVIKSFIERRGNCLTINVNDVEQMRAALKEPEKYRDLKIRVGGWEAFFTDLPYEYQIWQIRKHEQYAATQ